MQNQNITTIKYYCIILATNAGEGKKDTTSINTNKENKNNLTTKANYNPAQVTKAEKFPRNKEIEVSNPKIRVTNTLWTKQNQRKIEKIPECKTKMHTAEKLRRKIEIIREGAHAIWKERTRVHALVYEVRRHKSKARKKNKI